MIICCHYRTELKVFKCFFKYSAEFRGVLILDLKIIATSMTTFLIEGNDVLSFLIDCFFPSENIPSVACKVCWDSLISLTLFSQYALFASVVNTFKSCRRMFPSQIMVLLSRLSKHGP